MKANEEPEKIYCIPTEGGCYYITSIKPEPPFTDVVEYANTDAFIKKACNAYCNVCKMPNCRSNECKWVSDFKKAMED